MRQDVVCLVRVGSVFGGGVSGRIGLGDRMAHVLLQLFTFDLHQVIARNDRSQLGVRIHMAGESSRLVGLNLNRITISVIILVGVLNDRLIGIVGLRLRARAIAVFRIVKLSSFAFLTTVVRPFFCRSRPDEYSFV